MSLTACATGSSKPAPQVVTPRQEQYHPDFQNRLADEMENESKVACPRDVLIENCVAWKRVVIDYVDQRRQIQAAKTGD